MILRHMIEIKRGDHWTITVPRKINAFAETTKFSTKKLYTCKVMTHYIEDDDLHD